MPPSAPAIEDEPPRQASLTSSAASLAFGSLVTNAAQILTLSVLARLVAKPEIATFQQMGLIYALVSPVLLAGVPAALLYYVPRSVLPRERHAWVMRAYVVLGGMGLASALAVVALRHPLAALFSNPDLAPALVWYSPAVFFAFIMSIAPPTLVAYGRHRSVAVLNGLVGITTMTSVVVAALLSPTGRGLATALSTSAALVAAASVLSVRRATGVKLTDLSSRSGNVKRLLSYGLPLAATGLAGTLGYQFDRVVVGVTFSPSEFAVYALGAVELPLGLLVAAAVSNVLIPRLTVLWVHGDQANMIALWREAMRKTSLILLPVFVFAMAMSADLVHVLYGSDFSESIDVFRVYLFLLPLRIATWGLIPSAIGRTRVHLWASILILGANAVIAIVLVGPLGLIGPALAAPLATAAAAAYYVIRIRSLAGVTVRDLIPVRNLAGTVGVSILAAAPLLAIRDLAAPSSIRLLVAAITFSVVAPVALRRTKQISDDDWKRLRRVIGRWPRRGAYPVEHRQ
jgi:O-antigen/teichoic acid export membrane protein